MMQKKWESAFRARFTKYEEELRGYYMELYHNDEAAWEDTVTRTESAG